MSKTNNESRGAQLSRLNIPGKFANIKEIIILDGHRIVHCGDFQEFCHSDDKYLTTLRLSERKIQEKVYYKDKLFCFLDRNDMHEDDDTPIANFVLGGNRDA
jgi:hypothetical protein